MGAAAGATPFRTRASARYRISVTSVLLPIPTRRSRPRMPEREGHVDVLEVVLARAPDASALPLPLRRFGGMGTARSPRRNAPVIERSSARIASSVPAAMTSPPCSPAPGPMSITQSAVRIVSSSCSTTISVLPRSRSRVERRDQLRVVLLVEADRRLVEDVQDAHQARPDLRREPDALRLAAGQRRRRPIDGQVVEPDVDQEAEARRISLSTWRAIVRSRSVSRFGSSADPPERVGHRQRRRLGDVAPVDRHAERLRLEPAPAAGGARPGDHELLELGLDPLRLRLAVAPLEVRHEALERGVVVFSPRSWR